MKKLKRMISAATALAVLFSMTLSLSLSPASAAEFKDVSESDSYATAVGLLTSLGVIVGYEDGSFKPDNTITRAEAATVMVRALGRESQAKNSRGQTAFSDVGANDWESGYVNVATEMGIIVGFPDGTFKPDENVTYEQIVKMVVCALGYEVLVNANGTGYPMGYITAASTAGVTKGVGGSVGQDASRATVARLVYNSLEIEMMEATGISTGINGTTYSLNGKTILNDYLNMEKVDAVVKDTYLAGDTYSKKDNDITLDITKVYGSSDHVAKADYEKGESYTFEAGSTDAAVYLGYAVTAYVGEDDDTGKDTIYAIALASKNSSVEVDFDDFSEENSTDKLISYVKKANDKRYTELDLEKNYTLVENGRIVDYSVTEYFDDFDIMTLVDNDNDGDYEFVFVSLFTDNGVEFVVTDIDEDDGAYYFDGDGNSFEADTSDEDILYTVIRDGKLADFDDIDIDDVITVLDDSRDIVTVYVSSESVRGSIDEYDADEDEYTINDKFYTLSPAYSGKLDVGDEGIFYINYLGRIADSTVSGTVASGDYIFITNYDTDTKWNKTSYLVQAVTDKGVVKTYTLKSTKIKFIDSKGSIYKDIEDDEAYNLLTSASAMTEISEKYSVSGYAGVAKVKVNSSGALSEIYLPGTYEDFYAQTKYASDNSKEYSERKGTYGVYDLTGKIVVFNLDKSEEDLADAVEVGSVEDFFADGNSYSFIAYGERNDDIEAVVITDGIATIDYEKHATVITKVSTVTSNGERTTRYTGITDGKSMTYTVDPDESYDAQKGNVVMIEVGSDGYISELEIVASTTDDSDDLEDALLYADIPTDDDANVYVGLVEDTATRSFRIEGIDEVFYKDSASAYTLIDYTTRETSFSSSSFSGIKVTNSTETFVVVRTYEDEVIDVFMFRMDAGTYRGGSAEIWDSMSSVDDGDVTTEPSTAPTEATTAPTEATTAPTEATTAATEGTTAATDPTSETSTAATGETTATTETGAAGEPSSEAGTSTLSAVDPTAPTDKATEAPTEATTAPTEATTAPTEATTAPTEATTAPTEATTAPTEATTAPTEATTAPTEATTAPTEATTAPTEAATAPTEATTAPTESTTASAEEPSEKPAEPATEAPTQTAANPTEPTDATSPTEGTTAPTEAATNVNGIKIDTKTAKEVLALVNAERAKVGVPALTWNTKLAKAAEDYSIEMATYSFLSHTGKFGSTPLTRLAAAGITQFSAASENIAWNQRSAEAVVNSWMNSAGHKANILSPDFKETGVGLAIAADGSYYWTQTFMG